MAGRLCLDLKNLAILPSIDMCLAHVILMIGRITHLLIFGADAHVNYPAKMAAFLGSRTQHHPIYSLGVKYLKKDLEHD